MKIENPKAPEKVTDLHVKRAQSIFDKAGENDPPSAKEVIEFAAEMKGLDARCRFGKELMLKLSQIGILPKRSHVYKQKNGYKLKSEDQLFITNNCGRLSSHECAKNIFGDKIGPLSAESRAVREFYDRMPPELRFQSGKILDEKEYVSPKSLDRMLVRVNKYVFPPIDKAKMTNSEKLNLEALIAYMSSNRFLYQVNNYKKMVDREFFEATFIRYTYNKSDLTEEEVDQYVLLCIESIIGTKNREIYQGLQELLESSIESADEGDSMKIRMGLVESLKIKDDEYHKCVTRQGNFKKDLQGKRTDRINKRIGNHGSWLPIIETWKTEESRIRMIKLAEKRKLKLRTAYEDFEDMDQMIAEIYGVTEGEIFDA